MKTMKFRRLAKAAAIITFASLFAISCNNSTQTSEEKTDTTAMTTPEPMPMPVPADTTMAPPPNPNPCMVDFKAGGIVTCKGTCDSGSCDLYKRGKGTGNPWRKTPKEQEADTGKWEYHCWCFDPNRPK